MRLEGREAWLPAMEAWSTGTCLGADGRTLVIRGADGVADTNGNLEAFPVRRATIFALALPDCWCLGRLVGWDDPWESGEPRREKGERVESVSSPPGGESERTPKLP